MPGKLPNQVPSYSMLIIMYIYPSLLVCSITFLIFARAFDQASKELSKSAKKPFSTFHSTPKKKMQGNVFTFNEKRAPKTVDQDKMNQTTESPGSESPGSAEERENSKQPSHSPLSPTEDEGTQGSKSSEQSFAKGQSTTLSFCHTLHIQESI
jgi:hypothetical protein